MYAGLRRRRIEDKLGLTVFLQYGVVMADYDRAVGIPVGCDPQTEEQEITAKQQQGCSKEEQDDAKEDAPQPIPQIKWPVAHEVQIISLRRCGETGSILR